MYIIGEIKTGILFKDFYICTTYRKRQKFELISYCFFVPHEDFQVILGKRIYAYIYVLYSKLLTSTQLEMREKKEGLFIFGGLPEKKLLWQEECTFETFF